MKTNTTGTAQRPAAAIIIGLVALAWLAPAPAMAAGQATLTVELAGFKNDHGKAVLALFGSKNGFPNKIGNAVRRVSVNIKGGRARIVLKGVSPGTYAVAVFHDENGNGKLDTSWIGRPTEGVGMSNNARGRRGPPKFKDASFKLQGPNKKIRISIRY